MSKRLRKLIAVSHILAFSTLLFISPALANTWPTYTVSALIDEGWETTLYAPEGAVFTSVYFASYGTPDYDTVGWCHSETSVEKVAEAFIGKSSGTIAANNSVFGDPCGGTYKRLFVVLEYSYPEPPKYLNPPQNITAVAVEGGVQLSWQAPIDSGTPVERYAVVWQLGQLGWGLASTDTSIFLPNSLFESTGGLDVTYSFYVRSDNDSLSVYSVDGGPVDLKVSTPVTPEPTDPPVEPTETPTETPTPTPTEEPTPEPSPSVEPTVTPTPKPTASTKPEPEPEPKPEPETVDQLLNMYSEDEAIPAGQLDALGIDYSELPPDQLVQLDNGVVLTAVVADSLQIFESPTELLSSVFTDPGKALTAITNVGADMTQETRKQAQKTVVPAVIVTQVIAGTSAVTLIRKP